MKRWWIAVAGVVGVGLAVLLIPRPDTGGDLPARAPGTSAAQVGSELPRREGYVGNGPSRPGTPDAVTEAPEPIEGVPLVTGGEKGLSPAAERMAELRHTPEAQTAARVSAPWTQVRRVLQGKGGEAAQMAEDVDAMILELRDMRRDPPSYDWVAMEERQKQLAASIRKSPYADAEIESMLGLIEERLQEYHDRAAEAGAAAAN